MHVRTCRYVHVCFLHLAHKNNRLKAGDDNLPHICQCHVISWIKAAKGWPGSHSHGSGIWALCCSYKIQPGSCSYKYAAASGWPRRGPPK